MFVLFPFGARTAFAVFVTVTLEKGMVTLGLVMDTGDLEGLASTIQVRRDNEADRWVAFAVLVVLGENLGGDEVLVDGGEVTNSRECDALLLGAACKPSNLAAKTGSFAVACHASIHRDLAGSFGCGLAGKATEGKAR